jgi:drug/metabolite transporter (DMT)-like permease
LSREKSPESALLIFSVVLLGQIIMGGTFPAAKIALVDFDAFTLALFRYLIASACLLAVVYFTGRLRKVSRRDLPKLILLGILAIPLNQLLFLYGLQFTTPARSALWFGATPVFVYLLAVPFLREKTTLLKVIGTAASFGGVALVLRNGSDGEATLIGDLIVIAAVVSWAVYTVVGKPLLRKYGALAMTAYALSIGTLLYLPFGIYQAFRFDYSLVSTEAWIGMLYIAIATSVIGYSIWYWGLARMEAIKLAIFQNIQPVAGTILSVLIVDEVLGADFLAGGILIVGGVILTQRG